jgi:uncharacterized protein
MHLNFAMALLGLLIGALVGLTGMGGGALLTALLVLFFRVPPLAAISSDLLTSFVMKPFGAIAHMRRRTVRWRLVGLLTLGSAPAAFAGAVLVGRIGHRAAALNNLKILVGAALCFAVTMILLRQWLDRRADRLDIADLERPLVIRPLPTIAIGLVGGFIVGLTSAGSGAVVIALLLMIYPSLRPNQLVGTDIVQAIPLVGAATLGHLLFGDVQFAVTASVLVGAIPGVLIGAAASARAPGAIIRPAVTSVLLASAVALLNARGPVILAAAAVGLVASVLMRPHPAAHPTRKTP